MTFQKAFKFIQKTGYFFLLVFLARVLLKFEWDGLVSQAIFSFFFSISIVFFQVFDYERFDHIEPADFLESQHTIKLENSESHWKAITEIISQNFIAKSWGYDQKSIRIKWQRKMLPSFLNANRKGDHIILEIHRGWLSFLPDRATNWKSLHRLEHLIKKKTLDV